MIKKKNNEKNFPPPYGSVSKLREAFNLLSTRSFNSLTPADLTARNFSKVDAFQTVSGLKFLGVFDEDGSKTENLRKIQLQGEEKIKGLQDIVKNAYSKLFETVPNANTLSRNELQNEFLAVYMLSPRLAKTAVPVFIWLCKEAGLEVAEEISFRDRKASNQKSITKSNIEKLKLSEVHKEQNEAEHIIEAGQFKLILPKTKKITKALVEGKFKKIHEDLESLSKSCFESEEQKETGEVAEGLKAVVS